MWLRRTGFWVNVILLTCDAESFPEATWEFAYCLRTRYQVSKMGFCPRNKINFVSAAALHKLWSWILSPTCFCCRVEARFLGLDCDRIARHWPGLIGSWMLRTQTMTAGPRRNFRLGLNLCLGSQIQTLHHGIIAIHKWLQTIQTNNLFADFIFINEN